MSYDTTLDSVVIELLARKEMLQQTYVPTNKNQKNIVVVRTKMNHLTT